MWAALYRTDTGALVSVGTVVTGELPPGTAVLPLADRPSDSEMWDESSRTFVPRPAKVLVDRMDDLIDDPEFAPLWASLNTGRRSRMRAVLARLLGRRRYRAAGETMELD